MKKNLFYYLSTGGISIFMLMSSFMYLTRHEVIVHAFSSELVGDFNALGFPAWLIIPIGVAKLLGVIGLWAPIPKVVREWIYAGFFLNFTLALGAHSFNPINPTAGLTSAFRSDHTHTS